MFSCWWEGNVDEERRALLIGIGQAAAAGGALEPLDEAVEADLRVMSTALHASGYLVETLHNAGRSEIKSKIYEVSRDTPQGGTLLLYFTGHGLNIDRIDYLVPADAIAPPDGSWREPYLDSLLPANISPLLKDCRAGAVLWVIDACRTDAASVSEAFGNSIENGSPDGGFAVLTGCSAGEHSGFTDEGSFFTHAMANALGPLTPSRTVQDVFATARAKTREAALRHGLTQTPRIRFGTHAEAETKEREICAGRPLLEAWLEAAHSTPLWQHVTTDSAASVHSFQGVLGEFVEQCARTVHLAQQRLSHPDPWVDDDFPVRVLCDRLPLLLSDDAKLSAIEVVALVAAPFLHEVAWAERLSQAAEISPYALGRHKHAGAHRRHYEQIVEQYGRVASKLADCQAREHTEDAAAITMWLVHRWVEDRFQTDDDVVSVTRTESLAAQLGVADGRVHELSQLLRTAASGIGMDESFGAPHTGASRMVLLPGGRQPLRVRPLVALLRLATLLAVDVRVLPGVVAEHLAVTDPVLPQDIVAIARGLSWHREGNSLHLDAPCPHQAVHAALTEVADEADQLVSRTWELSGEMREPETDLLAAVPHRVTDRDLRPLHVGSQAVYEVPLLRFHLAHTEVRDLLMGEQLYGGEPELALRELYQNAMDACRYRAMRWDYLRGVGTRPALWTGQIVFTQGRDERGAYVECRDNGVGMSAEQLKQTFTRAGSRFERSKAFRKEQSRWLRHDPALRLYPNSRFGIGVFSYFMLADEMSIVTRQVSPDGIPAEHALRVEIPSSGSLFRIQRHDGSDDGLAEGGTRVRLYLRENAVGRRLSCVAVLRKLVRVSDFTLTAQEEAGPEYVWEPGTLQPLLDHHSDESLAAIPGSLWWVLGEGAILCDGIVTDQTPFGYVVNLAGAHAGKLSVSRKELQAFDEEWVEGLWRQGAKELVDWSGLSLSWLGRLDQRSNSLARVLAREWQGKGVRVQSPNGKGMDLDKVGWFHLDDKVTRDRSSGIDDDTFIPWRTAVLGQVNGSYGRAVPSDLVGHPVAEPGDAEIAKSELGSWTRVVCYAAEHERPLSEVLRRQRALRITHRGQAPVPVRGGALDWVPDAVDHRLARVIRGGDTGTVAAGDGSRHWGALVQASMELSLPLGDLVRRLARFAPLLPSPVPDVPAHHEDHVCTSDDIRGLFLRADAPRSASWRLADTPEAVRDLVNDSDLSAGEILRRLDAFSWLGWTPPALDEVSCWTELDSDLSEVTAIFTSRLTDGSRMLHWAATVDYADTLEASLGEAERELSAVADKLGLHYERRYVQDSAAARHVPSYDAAVLVRRLAHRERALEQGVDLEDLVPAQFGDDDDLDLERALADLRVAGVSVPDDLTLVHEWDGLPLRDRYVLAGKEASMEDEDYPASELTSAVLVFAAERLNEPLREVWDLAASHADRFGLTVPTLPSSLTEFRPTGDICLALVDQPEDGYGTFRTATWYPLTPLGLARYASRTALDAATAYERLRPLRAIGAPVPELSESALDALRGRTPDPRDLVVLGAEHRVTESGTAYSPLDLVSIAGRLGEPLPRTAARIVPYLPLCPSTSVLPAVPDVVPRWQDLALLTQGLNGVLPAVEGRVPQRHIALAAEAVGESEEWVIDRLRLYAAMFELVIDENGSDCDD
ncbi:caspase family protein [Streptomyces sp. NPDC057740]|uniref:HD domain-containing protein n=1 Tax=Streptomyces sp. NPDC057740 TaxID=3346234 RepID=UPI0036BF83DD